MSVSPFIRPIQTQGGSFYTFSSAAEDLTLTFNNSGKKFSFSKYALLNLPTISRPTADAPNEENVIQFDTIPGAFIEAGANKTNNQLLAESLQNYVLNYETLVTSQASYNPDSLSTVSERIFFKWLKETGALRFSEASTQTEATLSAGLRFTEEINSSSYNKVIQYIGEVDMTNSIKSSADAYSEVYVNIPTDSGATPLVLFKSTTDANYFSGMNIVNVPTDPANAEYLCGRNYLQTNPSGIGVFAFYDSDVQSYGATAGLGESFLPTPNVEGEYQLLKFDPSTSSYSVDWWFPYPEANSYWTQPPAASLTYDDWSNDSFKIRGVKKDADAMTEVNFKRSRLDGIGLDFDTSHYMPIATNPSITSFSDFNTIRESVSFEFNSVLLYYDVVDLSTGDVATNLFGILFLDNVNDTVSSGSYIPKLKKYKPNRLTGLNGNAYGFKINLKFDTNIEETAIVSAVNEYSSFSMHVFMDALNRMQTATDLMTKNQEDLITMQKQIDTVNELLGTTSTLDTLSASINNIETQLEAANLMFTNSSEIMNLISRNYQEIINIYSNYTSVQMTYNLDPIKQGNGIKIDKTVPNQITLNNDIAAYNLPSSPIIGIDSINFTQLSTAWTKELDLRKFNNYLKISNEYLTPFDRDVKLYVNDRYEKWVNGQSFKIVIDKNWPMDMFTLGSYKLTVFTDAIGTNAVSYGVQIGQLVASDFYNANGSLTLEIICLDISTYTFTYDIKY